MYKRNSCHRPEYNKIIENFQTQKIESFSKNELIFELKNPRSWLYEISKQECIGLFRKTGGFTSAGYTDDDVYRIGLDTTIMQIRKKYFFDLEIDSNILILKKIQSRIVNNIRNYFTPSRKINFLQFQNSFYPSLEHYETSDDIILEIDLKKTDRKTLEYALKQVWKDAIGDIDFDLQDFKELCAKFDFSPQDILEYDPYVLSQMTMEAPNNSNYQLVLVFDLEEAS